MRFPEERVRLVEQEHAVPRLGFVEDLRKRLLRFADVLRDDLRQVDTVEVQPELIGDALGREGLTGAGLTREQAREPDGAHALVRDPYSFSTRDEVAYQAMMSRIFPSMAPGTTRSARRTLETRWVTVRPIRRLP